MVFFRLLPHSRCVFAKSLNYPRFDTLADLLHKLHSVSLLFSFYIREHLLLEFLFLYSDESLNSVQLWVPCYIRNEGRILFFKVIFDLPTLVIRYCISENNAAGITKENFRENFTEMLIVEWLICEIQSFKTIFVRYCRTQTYTLKYFFYTCVPDVLILVAVSTVLYSVVVKVGFVCINPSASLTISLIQQFFGKLEQSVILRGDLYFVVMSIRITFFDMPFYFSHRPKSPLFKFLGSSILQFSKSFVKGKMCICLNNILVRSTLVKFVFVLLLSLFPNFFSW